MKYYSEHSQEYIENTKDANMKNLYSFFERYIPSNAQKIMDLGFGSGRDSLYFKSKGYEVLSLDPTLEFCEYGKSIGLNVECKKAEEIDYINVFDGIWACASLLHVDSNNLKDVFKRCFRSLTKNGVMYCSFKYGNFEGERNNRYYLDLTEERLKEFVEKTQFEIVSIIVTDDVRKDKKERWINAILRKS